MTYEDFLKTFINENKSKVTRDRLFGGYDILKYDYDKLTNECYEFIMSKMDTEFPRPDLNSEEYHDYYKNMMIMKSFCEAFQNMRINLHIYRNHLVLKYIMDNVIKNFYKEYK